MKKKTIIILLILTLSIYVLNISVQSAVEENDYQSTSLELTPHDPIYITSDNGLEVFPGTGTAENPYVIEGYNITTTDDNGIFISSTTKNFTVRNCYVDAGNYGIYIEYVADGTVTVINNTCNNNGYEGIYLWDSGNSTVANNTCSNNDCGIFLRYSGNSTVANNTCSNNDYGSIYLASSGNSTITNNMSNNNRYGIVLDFSGSSIVVNNTFTNCGLLIGESTIDDYLSNTVENNWVNGKKIGFYTNLDSTTINEQVYGQLILVNCTNVVVQDQILNNATYGLYLFSCRYSVIINNTCNNNMNGIVLSSSVSSTVINNTCSNNNIYGIAFYSSVSSTVANNTCNNNWKGISLWFSDSSTIANNTCNNNSQNSIHLRDSGSSTVANNMCSNNNNQGIFIEDSGSSTVANNTCSNNDRGIELRSSAFCVVTYNLLQENVGYGIYLRFDSDDNTIYHNNFVDNFIGWTSQAYDDCTDNFWYDSATLEGNFWSDWSGEGSYSIDGSANSADLYPLKEPAEHTTTEHTTTEHTTVESTTDENPLNFTFTLLMLVFPLILTRIISKKKKK